MSSFKLLDNNLKPRERIKQSEINILSDAELLAIIIGSGTKGSDVLDIAHQVLLEFNGLNQMQTCSIEDFQKIRGIGEAKAISLYAMFEISKRANNEKFYTERKALTNPEAIYNLCKPMIHYQQEKLAVICLNIRMELISKTEVFVGEISSVMIQPREIFKTVFLKNAYAFILVHNHPSGYCEASDDDIIATKAIVEGAKLLNILFVDHIVVGSDGYYSIRANNNKVFKS